MTTPNQALNSVAYDIQKLVGMGAFQVGAAAQNWGQNVTEAFARALAYGPATLLAEGWSSLEAFLAQLGSYLATLPLEALKVLQAFIPGSVLADFEDVGTAVATILNAFGTNLTLTYQAFEAWLSSVYNLLQTEVHQIMDIINNLLVTPITSRVTAFQDWFNSLTGLSIGISAAITGTPPSPATVQEAYDGAVADLGGLLNNLHAGVTGAVNAGQQATSDILHDALAGMNGAVGAAQAQLSQILGWLAPRPPAVVLGGTPPAPVEVPTGWESDWTLSGDASGSATVVEKGWSLVKSGHAARTLMAIHNTKALDTDYGSVRFLLATNIETPLSGGGGLAGNGLVFRANSSSSPTEYGELRFYYNKIELWSVSTGTFTLLKTWSITPVWGVTYSLDFGTPSGLHYYQLRANGLPLDTEYQDTGSHIAGGSGSRWGGQTMYTDNRGGTTETGPGTVGYWKLSDNQPTQKVGSGFKVCRVNTTGVSFSAGTSVIPANFYDTVDRITPDFAFDASESMITVRDEGWYTFTLALPFLASNGTYNIYGGVAAAIAVDGVLDSFAGPPGNAVNAVTLISYGGLGGTAIADEKTPVGPTGLFYTFPPIYCQAGSQVQPVYSAAGSMTISGGYGTQTAFERTTQYFAGAKLGQVVV